LDEAVAVVSWLNVVAFVGLAVLALRRWRARKDGTGAWAAAGFVTLGVVVVVGRILPEEPTLLAERIVLRADIVLLLFFPYFLYRFTWDFSQPSQRLTRIVTTMTAALLLWTIALPRLPQPEEPRPAWFQMYVVAFVIHWSVLSIVVAWRLWRAGRGEPSVTRRRMQMLSLASTGITLALVLVAFAPQDSTLALVSGLLAIFSAISFALALAPPELVRVVWRRPEQLRLQEAIGSLMQLATSQQEVASRVLAPMAAIVGARGVLLRNSVGEVVGTYNVQPAVVERLEQGERPASIDGESPIVELDIPGDGSLLVWTTPYTPYFGEEELRLLRTLGALTGLALDRARLFAQEREGRLALEQANEVKANFVALAAHELRTPITTVNGVAQTLTARREQLSATQRSDIEDALVLQTARLVQLTDQLLDLSRLDAQVIRIAPRHFPVRERIEELIATTAGGRAAVVHVEIDPRLEALADPDAFDRIVSNLIANALRYGEPPVVVRAERTATDFRVCVEDHGPGVAPEFVPSLFERFTRSAATQTTAAGTGLGLAIARSYARAHSGDVTYVPAQPNGSCFELVLPA
jgi:signal transduction histidine kinase